MTFRRHSTCVYLLTGLVLGGVGGVGWGNFNTWLSAGLTGM